MTASTGAEPRGGVREVAAVFLRLGATSFGGPAAHVAVMEEEFVRRRAWVTRERFLDLVSASNLIPGPNSTELAIHLGYVRAGWGGLVAAGACFILPAVMIVWGLAVLFTRFGTRPEFAGVMRGVQPVVVAVVLQAVWLLARSALRTREVFVVWVLAVVAALSGVHELLVLAGCTVAVVVLDRARSASAAASVIAMPPLIRPLMDLLHTVPSPAKVTSVGASVATGFATGVATGVASGVAATVASAPATIPASALFLSFAKIGSVLFGSGYVLLAFLRAEFVVRHGWLTEPQLLDAIAIGQVTPGPVFSSATFVGYLLGGHGGALAATTGIFLPAFVFVALSGPFIPRLRQFRTMSTLLDGLNAGSLALMAAVVIVLAEVELRAALVPGLATRWPIAISIVSALLLMRYRMPANWLLAGGALVGLLLLR